MTISEGKNLHAGVNKILCFITHLLFIIADMTSACFTSYEAPNCLCILLSTQNKKAKLHRLRQRLISDLKEAVITLGNKACSLQIWTSLNITIFQDFTWNGKASISYIGTSWGSQNKRNLYILFSGVWCKNLVKTQLFLYTVMLIYEIRLKTISSKSLITKQTFKCQILRVMFCFI